MIAGLEVPDAGGRIVFGDEDVTSVPVEKRHAGMMFQHYALFPQMSVEANIGYGLKIRGLPEDQIRQRVGELIDMVHLHGHEKKRPAALSGGQRQRVALARAIAIRPKVLLLDEPLTALDAKLKIALRDDMAQLLRQLGITTVLVTHDQQEAFAIADRLAIMHAGKIVQTGYAESLYRAPEQAFVADFLGTVNRIERTSQECHDNTLRLGTQIIQCPARLANAAHVLTRPEDIIVTYPANHNSNAIVVRRTFLGERVQLVLALQHGEHTTHLTASTHRDCSAQAGDAVAITIHPEHLFVTAQ
jgi:putative spermidine/putrescine transport system ATP-binding protein